MCGIAGILSQDSDNLANWGALKKMLSVMQHRGPDGWGTYTSKDMFLGHVRLSILDLESGHQPMATDRYVIAYNGEVYNHVELRSGLEKSGARFKTRSDTEVILKAVEAYGTGAFAKFNGQFAFILWDKDEKRLIAVRDRYGICPLYILQHRKGLYFASEMKAFDTIDGFERTYNWEHLQEHALFWNTLGDATVYNHIRSLPPGTFEIFQTPHQSIRQRYYEIGESIPEGPPPDFDEAKEEFRYLLEDAVRLRLRSDVPVGAYLSGGIDSSVVTHITKNITGHTLRTFSVGFEDTAFDESKYQREMANFAGTVHNEVRLDYKMINDCFLDAVYHFERPVFRTAGVPLFLLSSAVRDHNVKVVLTGEGADEILFGYDSFKEIKLLEFWRRFPSSRLRPLLIKKLYPHLAYYKNPEQFGFIRMYYEGFLNQDDKSLAGLNIRLNNNKGLLNFFDKSHGLEYKKENLLERIAAILPDNYHKWSLLQKNQFLEMKTLLSGYLLSSQADRMTMAHGIEGRYPFLDHRVVEKLFYFPDKYKLNGFLQKFILGETFKQKIPESILKRPKKPYTAPDLKSFFYGGQLSKEAGDFLSPEATNHYGVFEPQSVERFLKKFARRIPSEIGYRDNMIITFILSCHMAKYWAERPRFQKLDESIKKVEILE